MVLIAGGLGGFASWLYGIVMDEPVPGGVWGIFIAMILGAFAAGVGVYVLTNTDTRAFARTMFFAALCGFAWKPVCDAGKAFIEQSVQEYQDEAAQEMADELMSAALSLTNDLSEQEVAIHLEQVNSLAQATIEAMPNVNNPKVRRQMEADVNASMAVVESVAPKSPVNVSRVLENVGETAAQVRQPNITARSLTALDTLAETSPQVADRRVFSSAVKRLETNATERAIQPLRLRDFRVNR